MTASWTTEPVFALIVVGCENHEVQSRRRRDSNPRPSDQGASVLPLDHETSTSRSLQLTLMFGEINDTLR